MSDDPDNVVPIKPEKSRRKAPNNQPASGIPASGIPAMGAGWGGPAKGAGTKDLNRGGAHRTREGFGVELDA